MKRLFFIFLTFSLLQMEALEYSMLPGAILKDHNTPISVSTKSLDDFVEKGLSSLCMFKDEEELTHLSDRLRQWWYGGESGGTGFFITHEGHMITCKHVINNFKSPIAFLGLTGQFVKATIVAIHPTEDLAILKIDEPHNLNLSHFRISFTPEEIGNWVFSLRGRAIIGVPRPDFSGCLFALPSIGKIIGYSGGSASFAALSIAATVGNSGSPVFNLKGKVIGILTEKLLASSDVKMDIGVAGALPIHRVKDWIEETLRSDGYFETLE